MFKNLKIRWKILLSSYLGILTAVILMTTFVVLSMKQNVAREVKNIRRDEMAKVKVQLKNYVDIAYETISANIKEAHNKKHIIALYGPRLKNIVDIAFNFVKQAKKEVAEGKMSLAAAQKMAADNIKNIRYNQGQGYVWINDTTLPYPKMIMHPTVPALDGKVLNNPKFNCALGRKENLFTAFVKSCNSNNGEAYVDYLWPQPTKNGLTKEKPKLSYVREVKDWQWIIGTGIYVDEILPDIIEKTKNDIKKMRYNNGIGYFWINNTTLPYPKMIMHPIAPSLDGKVMNSPKFNCALGRKENLFTAFVKSCNRNNGEAYVNYLWPKPTKNGLSKKQPKLSYVREYKPLHWIVGTGAYIDTIDAMVKQKTDSVNSQIKSMVMKIAVIMVIVTLLALLGLWFTANLISAPLLKCTAFAARLGEGNLNASVDIDSSDEVGELASSMRAMGEKLKKSIGNIREISQHLSAGAASQAESIKETSSSLEEITSMTKCGLENAQSGEQLIDEAGITVIQANKAMEELQSFMHEIAKSSRETQQIIKTIDEIAFQTNLLALNAAVEAARAGEAGAGFGVVADEVRNLAMRAADAAQTTTNQLESTVKQIEVGDELTASASRKFNSVNDKVSKIGVLMHEISRSANEQSTSINQVDEAVSNINMVVQNTAADAHQLVVAVNVFQTDEDG
ncbi:MAG TPA: HAMP domain-containing protein [Desulfobacterales bacterium]|nr:HAMP domain-containing protein [Desulfobacterales bacterium]